MKKLIYLIVLAVIIGGGYWYFQNAKKTTVQNEQASVIGAQIVWVEGGVEYKDGGDWKRASANTDLKEGDSVETLADGRAIINLDDGSAIRLDNKSKVVLSSLKPDHITISNESGQVYARVAASERVFDVQAGNATYVSLGTAYKTINKEGKKGVEVYKNKVKVIKDSKEEAIVDEGNQYLLENKVDVKIEKKLVKMTETEIKKDSFVVWNKEEDQKLDGTQAEVKEDVEVSAETNPDPEIPVTTSKIALSAVKTATGVKFVWTVEGVNVDQGFKLVRSTALNPVYPGNDYQYLSNKDQRAYLWTIKDGKTYYFRICQYLGGKCGVYSNNVKMTAPLAEVPDETPSGTVSSISLSSSGGSNVSWKATGISEQGFKLVWSKNANPIYPGREGDRYNYYSDASINSGSLDAFSGAGTYYVRVCEYLGGKCGVYSNQITVNLE